MTLNNAYKIYRTLHKRHHQSDPNVGRRLKPLTMDQAVEAVCWSFLQKGEAVRKRKATHPPPTRNLQFVMDINGGNKIRTDIEGTYDKPVTHNHHEVTAATTQQNSRHQEQRMNKKKKSYSWYNHQSECQEEKAECKFEDCPGRQREFYKKGEHAEHQDHMIQNINVWNVVLRIRRTCIFVMISKKRKQKPPDVICFTMKNVIVPTQHVMMTLMMTRMMTTNTI